MPVITRKALTAKNQSGQGFNKPENKAAGIRLSQIFKKVSEVLEQSYDSSIAFTCNVYSEAFDTLANRKGSQQTMALKNLEGFDDTMKLKNSGGKGTFYDAVVDALPQAGSNKAEFETLLRQVNEVLELGLEKSILKPLDPKEQERRRQEQERQRREQERERLAREEQERQRRERERLQREQQERERLERERLARLRLERERLERERQRQLELEREREEQRKKQRLEDLKKERDERLKEEKLDEKDYLKEEVRPTKIEPDYQQTLDRQREAAEQLRSVEENDNILDFEKQRARARANRILNDDPLARRRQQKEDAALLAEAEQKNEEPIEQHRTSMISQEMKDSFCKRFPPSDELVAKDERGREFKGTESILRELSRERGRLYIELPDDEEHRCTAVACEDGNLLISAGPIAYRSDRELVRADEYSLSDEFEKLYAENGIESAVDVDGRVLTEKEEMLKALDKSGGRLMVFGKDKAFAIALENRDQELFATQKAELMAPNPETVSPDRVPEKTMLLGINQDDILYAEDTAGNRYETPDAIRNELRSPCNDERMYIYTKQDPESAYLVRYLPGACGISAQPIHKSQLSKAPDDAVEPADADMLEEKRILNWREDELACAVDDKGRRYETPEQIKTALYGSDKTLQIYTKGDELPFAVQKKNNRFFISPERVTKFEDQMKDLGEQLGGMDKEDFSQVGTPALDAKTFLAKNWQLGGSVEREKAQRMTGMDFDLPKIDFALDEQGRLYRGADKITELLSKPEDRTLYIFDDSGEQPYAVQKKDGMYYRSDERISTRRIMPDSRSFEAKKSLNVNDIVKVSEKRRVFELKQQTDNLGRSIEFYKNNIAALKKASVKPDALKKPVRPRLGFWNTIAYRVKRFITGGETEAHKVHRARLKLYEQDVALYPLRKKEHEAEVKNHNDFLNGGAEKLADYEQKLQQTRQKREQVKAERAQAEQAHRNAMQDNDSAAVNAYRSRIETRLEGVNDLRNKGFVTPQNIFAYTWLKEAECRGKKASDPAARKAFCAYVAASKAENDILDSRVGSETISATLEERKLAQINNGEVVNAMMKDPDMKQLFDALGDGAIEPETLKDAYMKKVEQRRLEKMDDVKYLENAKAFMENKFGKQRISETDDEAFEKTFEQVLRYKMIKGIIRERNTLSPTDDPALIDSRLKDVQKKETDTLRLQLTEFHKYPYRKAFESLRGQELTLDEMSNALDAKKHQLEHPQAPQAPQAQA